MTKKSAGLLPYRLAGGALEVLLIHPGGPFWAKKDIGAWSIAKGEYDDAEDPFRAALREFAEETGATPPHAAHFIALPSLRQPSGKVICAWAVEMDWDPAQLVSNTFELEMPKGSGRVRRYPEADRAAWFDIEAALRRIVPGQRGFIEALLQAPGVKTA